MPTTRDVGPEPQTSLEQLADRFRAFAVDARAESPSYARLSAQIADRTDLLELLAEAQPGQRRPTLLLAAVRYLLDDEPTHPLRQIYAGERDEDPWPHLLELSRRRREELLAVVRSRRTQTNEVGRAAGLLPALHLASAGGARPLAVVEIGASAGLNLMLDRYRYEFPPLGGCGPVHGQPVLRCQVVGPHHPPVATETPQIVWRTGLDLEPLDVRSADTERWLVACLWPGDPQREARLRAAVAVARREPPRLVAGDAVERIGEVLDEVPLGVPICLVSTWTLNYLPRRRRLELADRVAALGVRREIVWVSQEAPGVAPGVPYPARQTVVQDASPPTVLGIVRAGASGAGTALAWLHPHGAWIDWLAQPAADTV